jgi:CHRD domain
MKRPFVASVVAAGVFAVGGLALAGTMQFRSHLETGNEIPTPVNVVGTPAGDLKLKLSPDGQELRYDLKITDTITNVLMAHLHLEQNADHTGGIVVWLYPAGPPAQLIPGETDGRLARGVITPASLVGPLAGAANWDTFLADIQAGLIYANVHTTANPAGEIRDQVHLVLDDED